MLSQRYSKPTNNYLAKLVSAHTLRWFIFIVMHNKQAVTLSVKKVGS